MGREMGLAMQEQRLACGGEPHHEPPNLNSWRVQAGPSLR